MGGSSGDHSVTTAAVKRGECAPAFFIACSFRSFDVCAGVNEWRKHPAVTANTNIRYMFPGLGVAVVAFTGFMIAEKMLSVATGDAHQEKHGAHH
jgi:NADH dehydrogenase (ubiquinone) 1 beta subcomplex subunit 3